MGRGIPGVQVRDTSIRITFTHQGKACAETLTVNGKPLAPSPANLKFAERTAVQVKERVRLGTFSFAEFFPDSKRGQAELANHQAQHRTLSEHLILWLKACSGLAVSSQLAYKSEAGWWTERLGDKRLPDLKPSDIQLALAESKLKGGSKNTRLTRLRSALEIAVKDKLIDSNPCDEVRRFPSTKSEPDPFTVEETNEIIQRIKALNPKVGNYFELKFFTGMRTGESIAVRWKNVNVKKKTLLVCESVVVGKHKASTKTYTDRVIHLSDRALQAVDSQMKLTGNHPSGLFLPDPISDEAWAKPDTLLYKYWQPALDGIRYRDPYQCRHTYATMMLMAGVTPAFAATQMGHSIQMFLGTYSRWINGNWDQVEMGRLNQFVGPSR